MPRRRLAHARLAPLPSRLARIALTMSVTLCLVPVQASGQSLAAIARREQARRDLVERPSKVYTNDDLKPYPVAPQTEERPSEGASSDAPSSDAETPARPESTAEQTDPEDGPAVVRDEAFWRGRVDAVRAQMQRNELFQQALQTRVNALTTDFVNIDDPAQRAVVAVDRQRAIEELERVGTEIERLRDDLADIEEEARRAGVPPGWLR